MSAKPTPKRSTDENRASKGRTDWDRLRTMSERDIVKAAHSDPDAPLTDKTFWRGARVIYPEKKLLITVRLDRDIVSWFKRGGRGYQTRINAVLRTFVDAKKDEGGALR